MSHTRKAVFALASHGKDLYTAMARVAVASIRLSNPDLTAVLVCDQQTGRALREKSDPIAHEFDELLTVPSPPGDNAYRSRFIKTSLRSAVSGPFLYLDVDVVVRTNLSAIFTTQADIAGAPNHSRSARGEQLGADAAAAIADMGWDVSPDIYINAGVLYFNDTVQARRLSEEWHRRWLSWVEKRGDHRDQPALNAALFALKPRLEVLPHTFNAQFKVTPDAARRAAIWHYYGSDDVATHTEFERLAGDLLHGATLNRRRVARVLGADHPWRRTTRLDDRAAARVMIRNRFDGYAALWLQRKLGDALRAVPQRTRRLWQAVTRT
jgi:hypothetical protein